MEFEIVSGSYDGLVQGFCVDALDPGTQGLRRKFHEKGHCGCVRAVACGGRYLATGSTDETIKLYNIRKHTEIGTLLQQEGSITWLTFHKERLLLSASEDGSICVWKCGEGWQCLATLTGHKYAVTSVSVHPSGKLALSVGKDRTVRTWDLTNFRQAFRLRLPKAAELVLWSPIGDQYALSVEKTATIYDVSTGKSVASFEVERHINCFMFIQDNVIAIGSEHSCIFLYSTTTGNIITKLEGHTNRVKGLVLSPAADLLFSASSDGTIKAWKLQDPLSESKCLSSIDTGSRLTCMTIVPPSGLFTKEPSLKDDVESKETAHTYERSKTAPSCTSEKEKTEKRQHREVMVSMEPDPSARTKKRKRGKKEKGLAERESRGRISQVVMSGVKTEKRQHREVMVSMEPDPSARTKKRKRGKKEKGLAERESRGRISQVVMSGVKVKMSKRRLLLRKRYYNLKRLGHKQ